MVAAFGSSLVIACSLLCWRPPPFISEHSQSDLLRMFRQEFVRITPGEGKYPPSFEMGGPEPHQQPRHQVHLKRAFSIARYETTQELYQAVMGDNPSRWQGPRNSVEMVSFEQAVAFCEKATGLMRQLEIIDVDQEIRLPSEAEWEYVARAGSTSTYCFGDDPRQLDDFAWHTGNAAGNDPPVGAKKPNAWGLYDTHGYLWEWCADHGHPTYENAPTDGSAWITGGDAQQRVIRGGSWKDPAALLASACRSGQFRSGQRLVQFQGGVDKSLKDDAVGFRCVLVRKVGP